MDKAKRSNNANRANQSRYVSTKRNTNKTSNETTTLSTMVAKKTTMGSTKR